MRNIAEHWQVAHGWDRSNITIDEQADGRVIVTVRSYESADAAVSLDPVDRR